MEPIAELQKIGFTESEAKVYMALLQNPDCTGYEASRESGVPRAKVYEVLSEMERKGFILVSTIEGRQLYRALPPKVLLNHHRTEMERVLATLDPQLLRLEQESNTETMVTIRGQKQAIEMARHMLGKAKRRIFICGMPEDLVHLENDIKKRKEAGVKDFILVYGERILDGLNQYNHSVGPIMYLRVLALGRWFAIAVDNEEALIAQIIDQDRSRAFWTKNPAIILAVTGWITHDITHYIMNQEFKNKEKSEYLEELRKVRKAINQIWTQMWLLNEEEGPPKLKINKELTLEQIFEQMTIRFSDTSFGLEGTILFDIKGEDGGSWYLKLKPAGIRVDKKSETKENLKIEMDIFDFKAMMAQRLPFNAFFTKDRIKIEGETKLAKLLPHLLS